MSQTERRLWSPETVVAKLFFFIIFSLYLPASMSTAGWIYQVCVNWCCWCVCCTLITLSWPACSSHSITIDYLTLPVATWSLTSTEFWLTAASLVVDWPSCSAQHSSVNRYLSKLTTLKKQEMLLGLTQNYSKSFSLTTWCIESFKSWVYNKNRWNESS